MPGSRPSIRDIIKNGQFTTRDLNAIPEEKARPDSSSTIDSEPSDPSSMTFPFGSNRHAAREGDVILMPLDLGIEELEPDLYLTGTPSIITYTVSRGYSSVRMEEIDLPRGRLPTIEENVSSIDAHAESLRNRNGFPIITPPPNFTPVHATHSESQNYSDALSSPQQSQQVPHMATVLKSPQSTHSLSSHGNGETESRTLAPSSSAWTLSSSTAGMPPLPSQGTSHPSNEKHGMTTGSAPWPLQEATNRTSRVSVEELIHSPYSDFSGGASTLQNSPGSKEFNELKSRFSWADMDEAHRSWFQRWLHDGWLLELTCLCLSAAFMAVICVLGLRFNGTEIPQAWAFGITLNAMISILAAFSRICLFFPTAEILGQIKWYLSNRDPKKIEDFEINHGRRDGPMESIKLLARTKRITWGSIIGAMLLLALPMDFFFQQFIHYPVEWLPAASSGNGTMPRSVNYSPALTTYTVNTTTILYPEPVLEGNLMPWVVGNGQDSPLGFDCPTNNCTFPPFWTLALESKCKEMPTLLRPGCETGPAQWRPSATSSPNSNGTYVSDASCGWYVDGVDPSGAGTLPILMSGYATANDSKREALVGRMLPLRDIFTKKLTLGAFTSYNFQDITYPAEDFLVASTPGGIAGAYNNNTPVVNECVVYWTAQKMNVTVFEGKAIQKVLETKLLDYGANPAQPAYHGTKFMGNYSMAVSDLGNATTMFTVDNYAARRVSMVIEDLASSAWYAINDTSPLQVKWMWTGSPPKLTPAPTGSGGWLQGEEAGLSNHLARLITSMNHVIWQTDNAKKQKADVVSGQAWRQAVVVRPKWVWITAPGVVLLFTTIFIVTMIVRDSGDSSRLGVWRTAALTVKVESRTKLKKRRPNQRY